MSRPRTGYAAMSTVGAAAISLPTSTFCTLPPDRRRTGVVTPGVTTSRLFVTHPVETIETALMGARCALQLAAEKQVRGMVYLSSMEAFGVTDPALPSVTETQIGYIDPQSLRSSYSESKRMAECLCAAYAGEYGVPVRAARRPRGLHRG